MISSDAPVPYGIIKKLLEKVASTPGMSLQILVSTPHSDAAGCGCLDCELMAEKEATNAFPRKMRAATEAER